MTESLFPREVYRTTHNRALTFRLGSNFCIIIFGQLKFQYFKLVFNSAHLADNIIPPGSRFYKIDVFVSLFLLLFLFCSYYYCSVYKGGMLCQFELSLCVCVSFFFLQKFCIYVLLLSYKNITLTCPKSFKQPHIN